MLLYVNRDHKDCYCIRDRTEKNLFTIHFIAVLQSLNFTFEYGFSSI